MGAFLENVDPSKNNIDSHMFLSNTKTKKLEQILSREVKSVLKKEFTEAFTGGAV